MRKPSITAISASEEEFAIGAVVLAFSADPAARWLYPDSQQYLTNFPSFVKAFAGAAFEHASAYCIDHYSGVALWLPPGIHPDEKALVGLLERTVRERDRADVFAVLEQMDRYHPAEPHWYLPMIGVDPAKQGNGFGSALLKHALERCDVEDKLAYLESSSPQNIPLYERHGFELLGTIQEGSSPPVFPMLRKPRRLETKQKKDLFALQTIAQPAGIGPMAE
jgi:ribosomal protein S18 acetylase RimI-like enzyme